MWLSSHRINFYLYGLVYRHAGALGELGGLRGDPLKLQFGF